MEVSPILPVEPCSCGGNFRMDNNTSYDIELTGTSLILNGSGNQLIQDYDGNSIHHLVIAKPSGTATINGANLSIAGNLTIDGGTFSLGSLTCNVAGTTNINNGGTLAMNNAGNNLTTPVYKLEFRLEYEYHGRYI
jgi:hypothetical protein